MIKFFALCSGIALSIIPTPTFGIEFEQKQLMSVTEQNLMANWCLIDRTQATSCGRTPADRTWRCWCTHLRPGTGIDRGYRKRGADGRFCNWGEDRPGCENSVGSNKNPRW